MFSCHTRNSLNSSNSKNNTVTTVYPTYEEEDSGKPSIIENENTNKNPLKIFEYIIPSSIDKDQSDYKSCKTKLDDLKKSIDEYKKIDSDKILINNFTSMAHKMWYCPQTAGASKKSVDTIDSIVNKNVKVTELKEAGADVEDNDSDEVDDSISEVLMGERDFNSYLKAVIEGKQKKANPNKNWEIFIDDKVNWLGTLVLNKERTVVNDPNNLNQIFNGNKKLQELMKGSVDKQQDFFDHYIIMIKNNKKSTVDSLCNIKNIIENEENAEEERSDLYFKALLLNGVNNLDIIVKNLTNGENQDIQDALQDVHNVTDEYLEEDPYGEALAEFTKIIFSGKGTTMKMISSFLKKKGEQIESYSTKTKSSKEIAENTITGMKYIKKALGFGTILISISGQSDVERTHEEKKILKGRFKTFIKLLKIYLTFGIEFTTYLRDCDRKALTNRITSQL